MKKKESTLQVDWTKDKLGIKDNVIGFANILKQEKYTPDGASKVYSISAEFGIGKTFFCKRLQDVLKLDGIPVSMLNIWEMDFYENPLIPVLIKLQDIYINNNKFRVWASDKLKFGINLISWFIKKGLKYCGFNIDKLAKLYKQLKPSTSDLYNSYIEYEEQLSKTKNFLASWAKRINKPIIIVIDELDRCRPDYAVKTLEILKHFFDIPGIVFVLSIDEEQLKSSVETLFGTKNFDGYKRKFINNSFILPAPNKEKYTDFLYMHSGLSDVVRQIENNKKDLIFKTVIKDSELRHFNNDPSLSKEKDFNKNQTSEKIIKRYFTAYSIWFDFSLRQMEQVFDRLVLFSKNILSNNELYSPDLAVLLVCLHEFDLKIYDKFRLSSSKVYGQHGGVLKNIYNISKADSSIARSIYGDKADTMFGTLNRNLIPKVPEILGFSTIGSYGQQNMVIIHDDIDRFFAAEESQQHPLTWIAEVQNHETGEYSMVQNNRRVAVIINSKRDAAWKEPPVDIDTASQFDLAGFRKRYFDKMDFISNFE